jgi:hypothetical protein
MDVWSTLELKPSDVYEAGTCECMAGRRSATKAEGQAYWMIQGHVIDEWVVRYVGIYVVVVVVVGVVSVTAVDCATAKTWLLSLYIVPVRP